ncbi:MAG: coenzyme F420 hydrogenase subunit beta [Euryarchaeota archaeon]|nr:coenzyme F420 hydrogenase subunit beta [Euryarchaeota archaeon]
MVLGKYTDVMTVRATDKALLRQSQDGGIVTSLFIQALENGVIEGAVVAMPTDEPWNPQPYVATTPEEIIAAAGTKYVLCPNVNMVKMAAREYGLDKIGMVGMHCLTYAVRKMQLYPFGARHLPNRMALLLGIFCTENFHYEGIKAIVEELHRVNIEQVKKMDVSKGKMIVSTTMGDRVEVPVKLTHNYVQPGCFVCPDLTARTADISTGSIGSPDGWSTVMPRTQVGKDLFQSAVDAGIFETKPIDPGKFGMEMLTNLAQKKWDRSVKTRQERAEIGLPNPF